MESTAKPERSQLLAWTATFMIAFLAALTFLTIPRKPFVIYDEVSEKAVLSYAHEHRLQFGTDIVFTYGPLGFLITRHFFPQSAGLRMMVDILLGLMVAGGVCQVARRLEFLWRAMVLCLFVYLAANIDPRADLLIYIGLLCWGGLCLIESGRPLAFSAFSFTVLAVFGVLVKANFLSVACLSAAAILTDLLLRGRRFAALALIVSLCSVFALGWWFSGQRLLDLGDFFGNAWSIIQGYDQAVGLDGLETFRWRGLLTALLAMGTIIIRTLTAYGKNQPDRQEHRPAGAPESLHENLSHTAQPAGQNEPSRGAQSDSYAPAGWRRAVLLIWLSGFMFVVWKHGFVRADLYHMGYWFGFAPVLVLILEILPCAPVGAQRCARILGVACCLVAVISLQSLFFSSAKSSLIQPFQGFRTNLGALLHPADYRRQMLLGYEQARQVTQLPKLREIIGRSTVDVFGQDQCYAVFNNLNYHPRPVFQSYMAYNVPLMQLNENFYLSQTAPEYVLFGLNAVDRKFPPLEDARVLRHLLLNYEPIGTEGPFLLLQSNTCSPPSLTLLREGTARTGERISLMDSGASALWMEIDIEASGLGRLRQLFYKSSKIRLALWAQNWKTPLTRMSAPAPMLAAGFLVSPSLLNNQDVLDLYDGKAITRPAACSIQLNAGEEQFWKPTVRFRIYKIEKRARLQAAAPKSQSVWSAPHSRAFGVPARRSGAVQERRNAAHSKRFAVFGCGWAQISAFPGSAGILAGENRIMTTRRQRRSDSRVFGLCAGS